MRHANASVIPQFAPGDRHRPRTNQATSVVPKPTASAPPRAPAMRIQLLRLVLVLGSVTLFAATVSPTVDAKTNLRPPIQLSQASDHRLLAPVGDSGPGQVRAAGIQSGAGKGPGLVAPVSGSSVQGATGNVGGKPVVPGPKITTTTTSTKACQLKPRALWETNGTDARRLMNGDGCDGQGPPQPQPVAAPGYERQADGTYRQVGNAQTQTNVQAQTDGNAPAQTGPRHAASEFDPTFLQSMVRQNVKLTEMYDPPTKASDVVSTIKPFANDPQYHHEPSSPFWGARTEGNAVRPAEPAGHCERIAPHAQTPLLVIDLTSATSFQQSITKARNDLKNGNRQFSVRTVDIPGKEAIKKANWQYKTKYRTMQLKWDGGKSVDLLMGHNIYIMGIFGKKDPKYPTVFSQCEVGGRGIFPIPEVLTSYDNMKEAWEQPSLWQQWTIQKVKEAAEMASNPAKLAAMAQTADRVANDYRAASTEYGTRFAAANRDHSRVEQAAATRYATAKRAYTDLLQIQLIYTIAEAIRFKDDWEDKVIKKWGDVIEAPIARLFQDQWAANACGLALGPTEQKAKVRVADNTPDENSKSQQKKKEKGERKEMGKEDKLSQKIEAAQRQQQNGNQ